MAQDIRELLKKEKKLTTDTMPEGHESRFLDKLEKKLPEKNTTVFTWFKIAASVIIFFSLSVGGYYFLKTTPEEITIPTVADTTPVKNSENKSLGDLSPDLKKVEDYYLASINLELSRVKYTNETKEVFDGYLVRLNELTQEYERLSEELTTSGPNELLINALIDNLKFRLNLLYKLREHLNELQEAETENQFNNQLS